MKTKYNNKTTTCFKEDARVINKLKNYMKCSSSNEVIHNLLFTYINGGNIPENIKQKVIGVKYYNDLYNK